MATKKTTKSESTPAAAKKPRTAKSESKPAAAKSSRPAKSEPKPAAAKSSRPAKSESKPAAAKSSRPAKSKSKYGVGDKVVHPQHGAATIAKRLKQEFAGEKKDYFVLDIATEQLTVMVPVASIEEVIRPIISKTQARNVLSVLKQEPQEAGSNWSRWYKVLNEKMTSGDIFQVAEVVRDLNFAQQTKGISPALKRMLSKARVTLTSELQFSLEVDEDEAVKRLDRALPKFEVPEE